MEPATGARATRNLCRILPDADSNVSAAPSERRSCRNCSSSSVKGVGAAGAGAATGAHLPSSAPRPRRRARRTRAGSQPAIGRWHVRTRARSRGRGVQPLTAAIRRWLMGDSAIGRSSGRSIGRPIGRTVGRPLWTIWVADIKSTTRPSQVTLDGRMGTNCV